MGTNMGNISWIKITTSIFDDEKIKIIETGRCGNEKIVIWFKLLALAGKINNRGNLTITDKTPYTIENFSKIFRNNKKIIQESLELFQNLNMIYFENGTYSITNWEKHQSIDKLDKIRENTSIRVKKFREKQKQSNVTVTGNVTQSNAIEIDKELDIDKDNKKIIEKNVTSTSKSSSKSALKKVYGQFENVKLSDDEYQKTIGNGLAEFIENLSRYKASTGKTYKSDYATICQWKVKHDRELLEKSTGKMKGNTGNYPDLAEIT